MTPQIPDVSHIASSPESAFKVSIQELVSITLASFESLQCRLFLMKKGYNEYELQKVLNSFEVVSDARNAAIIIKRADSGLKIYPLCN